MAAVTTPRDRVLAFLHARANRASSVNRVAPDEIALAMPPIQFTTEPQPLVELRAAVLSAADLTELVRRIDAIDRLFAAGPDTPARTTQRPTAPGSGENITCVEVPVYDLAAALQWSPNLITDPKD